LNFTFDISLPTATVVSPVHGNYYNSLATISGNLNDLAPERVEIFIKDMGGQSASLGYYNGRATGKQT